MASGDIQHVSDTAFLVAQCRAIESARGDALFHDPLAAKVAGDKGEAIIASFPSAKITWVRGSTRGPIGSTCRRSWSG
jgi:O-methyltransferase involved in polyketide biosynthesis